MNRLILEVLYICKCDISLIYFLHMKEPRYNGDVIPGRLKMMQARYQPITPCPWSSEDVDCKFHLLQPPLASEALLMIPEADMHGPVG